MFDRRDILTSGAGLAAALAASRLVTGPALAATGEGFKVTGQPWPLRGSEAFEYESISVGDRMAVGVWAPPAAVLARSGDENPPLDIVYVLDGSWALGMAATICEMQYNDLLNPGFAPVLLVGVDYPVGQMNSRSRDYSMADSVPSTIAEALSAIPQMKPGGADKFLTFLEQELDPLIRAKYKTTNRPAGILGDSFGGTFTFYAFLKQSKLFDRYWLGSPAIFTTGTDYVAQFERQLKDPPPHPTKMFLSVGSRELNGGNAEYEDMGRNFKRLVNAMNETPNARLSWSSKIYDGYTHTSVVAPALNDALLYLYGK